MDLLGRTILYSIHNASVYHQRGPISLAAISHEVRSEQDSSSGHPQDRVRVVAVDSHELTTEPHVQPGPRLGAR